MTLATENKQQESFGFAWSHSQRHARGWVVFISNIQSWLRSLGFSWEGNRISGRDEPPLSSVFLLTYSNTGLASTVTTKKTTTNYRQHYYLPTQSAMREKFTAETVDGNEPNIVSWNARLQSIVDEDYPEATGGYGRTRKEQLSSSLNMQYLVFENTYNRTRGVTPSSARP